MSFLALQYLLNTLSQGNSEQACGGLLCTTLITIATQCSIFLLPVSKQNNMLLMHYTVFMGMASVTTKDVVILIRSRPTSSSS